MNCTSNGADVCSLFGDISISLDQNECRPAVWACVDITLLFSQKQKAAEDEDNTFETSRTSYEVRNELVSCDGKHNLKIYLVQCGLKLQDVLKTAVWLRW